MLNKLETLNKEMQYWNKEMDDCRNRFSGGDEIKRQKLLKRATEKEKEVEQLRKEFMEAHNDYWHSFNDLNHNFTDCCATDDVLRNDVSRIYQKKSTLDIFDANYKKICGNFQNIYIWQYRKGKKDVILHVKAYQTMVDQLEDWSKKLPSLTNEMEVWNADSTDGETKRQELLERAKQQKQEMKQVMKNVKEAKKNYQGSLDDLQKNLKNYCDRDLELQNVVNAFNQANTRMTTYKAYYAKIREAYSALKNPAKRTSPEEK